MVRYHRACAAICLRRPNDVTEASHPRTLYELLASGVQLPLDRALALVRVLALAVDALHAHQRVHGSLNLATVQVDGEDRVTLLPPSIGAESDEARTYWSPQRQAGEPAGHTDDLYALGLIAAALLSGPPDHPADRPLTDEIEAVLRAQRSWAPSERFASGAELAAELERAAALTPSTPGPSLLPPPESEVRGKGFFSHPDAGGRATEPAWAAARRVAQARAAHRLALAELPDRGSRERIRTIVRHPVDRRAYPDFPLSGGWVAVLVVVLCSVYLFPIYFMLFPHG